jgi:uncharacterized membrane protein YjfL (UPF0719 family)
MIEILDKLFIRALFIIIILLILVFFKYIHYIFYPPGRKQYSNRLNPISNPANTLHFFSRIIGLSIIASAYEISFIDGLGYTIAQLFIWGTLNSVIYLISIFFTESIILYQFDYVDEVLKRKNFSYSIISFTISITLAILIKRIIDESENSIVIFVMLWLFALVLFGLLTKSYRILSRLSFNKHIVQKEIGVALSYSGFLFGLAIIISMAFDQEHYDIKSYALRIIMKLILALLFLPFFYYSIVKIFRIKITHKTDLQDDVQNDSSFLLSYGLLEGALFFSTAILTTLIVYKINFVDFASYFYQ